MNSNELGKRVVNSNNELFLISEFKWTKQKLSGCKFD